MAFLYLTFGTLLRGHVLQKCLQMLPVPSADTSLGADILEQAEGHLLVALPLFVSHVSHRFHEGAAASMTPANANCFQRIYFSCGFVLLQIPSDSGIIIFAANA